MQKKTIFMKCQILFSRNNKKKYFKMSSAEIITLGPVVQSIADLTSLLMTNWLTVAAKVFSNTLIFLLQKCE